jgi:uncharacterized protein YjiS (DUF1127 family)
MTTQTVMPIGGIAGAWRGDLHETSRLSALFASLAQRWAAYQTYRDTLAELETLSDRELNDIGISRWDIRRIARESAHATHGAHA